MAKWCYTALQRNSLLLCLRRPRVVLHLMSRFSSLEDGTKISDAVTEFTDIGQPTPQSHKHLFNNEADITPGITRREYASRRQRLLSILKLSQNGQKYKNHAVILFASQLKFMSADIPYPFHQNTDFLYLTGLQEPDAALILECRSLQVTTPVEDSEVKFILFVKPKDRKRELWDGPVVGERAAVDFFGADEAYPLSSLPSILKTKYGSGDYCFWMNQKDAVHQENFNTVAKVLKTKDFKRKALLGLSYNMQMIRLVKSAAEAHLLARSASIASAAFASVMQSARPGMTESNLHALLEFRCRILGAQHLSFPPVVAGGTRANTLHYINNTQVLGNNDLVLMDGGCVFHGYASDITRTWPVSGRFSAPQRQLYEIVLRVQEACLQQCKPGISIEHLHHVMLVTLGAELQELGLIPENISESVLKREVAEFCPHHLGHFLGMDTHDTALIHKSLPLQPGMVFTVEPGLYIPMTAYHIPEKFRGIGIRIEDDVLMTSEGPKVLTGRLPKTVEDIEMMLSQRDNER